MPPSPPSKLVLKNPLLLLLQRSKTLSQVLQIHAQLITSHLLPDPFAVSRLLLSLTSNASTMNHAELLFSQVQKPHTFLWNSMIRGYTESSNPRKAVLFFARMRKDGVEMDFHTYPFVLKACGLMSGFDEGREVHGEVVKRGVEFDLFVRNGLISMYCRCGEMGCAKSLFDGFGERDVVSWNTMVGGYVAQGGMVEAQKLFDVMPERDAFSWAIMIDGYGKKLGNVVRARELFNNMPKQDLVSWNSMIAGYADVGEMAAAHELFEKMDDKNVISWSIMIDGYARYQNPKEALNLFQEMLCQSTKPDKVSVVGAIQACAQLGALDQGRWIHTYIEKNRIISDVVVQTALMDMYMKCCSVDEACSLFCNMLEKSVVSWNVMIVGLGINGYGAEALGLFAQMVGQGVLIDDVTLLGVLTACSHAGLATEGLRFLESMRSSYRIEPKVEHYSCIIDLLSRAGRMGEARSIIEAMPMRSDSALWGSLLAACRTQRNLALAEISLQRLVELKADDCGVYILMSNIYAEEGMWEDVHKIRKLMTDRGMRKETGRSVIEVNGVVHEFVSDICHFSREEISLVIRSLSIMIVFAR